MNNYITQLLADIEGAILHHWQECPPHFYQMGLYDPFLEPPAGWEGPPLGYANEAGESDDFFDGVDDALDEPSIFDSPEDEAPLNLGSTEERDDRLPPSLSEAEDYVHGQPDRSMFQLFGFEEPQFPPTEKLTDEELDALTLALCRLWAAYNFTPVFPSAAPGRLVYPLLLERMAQPAFALKYGNIGVEFCGYDPTECPFGAWCSCKLQLDDRDLDLQQ